MSKDPAILFYTSDFITGTITMTDEQRGKYITLLCLQHQKGGRLSEKDMLNICGTHDEDIFAKFQQDEDGYFNVRMDNEITKRKNYSESRRKNREKKTHDEDMNNICDSHDLHMEDEDINKDIDKNKDENRIKKEKNVKYGEFVSMQEVEYQRLLKRFGNKRTARMIEVLDNYKGSTGRRYKSDYRTILNWVVEKTAPEFPTANKSPTEYKSSNFDEISNRDYSKYNKGRPETPGDTKNERKT